MVLGDQSGVQLVTESKFELVVSRLELLNTACGRVRIFLAVPVALLAELLVAVGLICDPSVVIVRGGHIEPVDAAVL